jgi:hypothetical protein
MLLDSLRTADLKFSNKTLELSGNRSSAWVSAPLSSAFAHYCIGKVCMLE